MSKSKLNFVIKNISKDKQGLFSNKYFSAGETIMRFDCKPVAKNDISEYSKEDQQDLLQIGLDLYLDLKDHISYFINHHCQPNCILKIKVNKCFLVAMKNISPGDQIYFDFSTTSNETEDTFSMDCNCSQFYCRKLISGYSSLPDDIKKKYIELGGIPSYLKDNK